MRHLARLAATTVFIGLLGASIPAQQPPAQQPPAPPQPAQPPAGQTGQAQPPAGQKPPVIRSGINFVSVDVIVTDKKTGNVVLDLKPDDFEVREDKKPQKIETFQTVRIDPITEAAMTPAPIRSTDDEEREAKKADVRLFIMLLDDYHVRRGNDLVVRQPLIDFVQNQLGPQDMVAIMYPLTPVTDLTFTRNHDSLIQAINSFLGRKGDYTPRNEFEDRYANYPAQQVEDIRNDVTMGALKGASVRLGGMRDGRKSIIFVSEGLTGTLPPQLSDPVASLPGFGNPARQSPGMDAPQNPRTDAVNFFNEADLDSRLREVYDTANRNNTSIYAVDPRGLATFEYGIEQGVSLRTDQKSLSASLDTLRILADNTDGRAIVSRNDIASGMKQIMTDSSGYYLLGYTSSAAPTDGKFHSIDVKVKRPGVEVRARKGYWAYTLDDVKKATEAGTKAGPPPAIAKALNKIAEPSHGHSARFWVGTERADAGKARVDFAWEPIPPAPGSRTDDTPPARVMLTAVAADGSPLYRGSVPDAPPQNGSSGDGSAATNGSEAAVPGSGAATSFMAPPGPIQLRIEVEGSRGEVIDSTLQDLTVPDYTKTQVSIGTPKVFRTRTAHEMLLVRNNPKAVPTVDREFSRTERLLVTFDAYASGGATPDVTAKLLNRAGQTMADVPVQAQAGKPFQIDLPLAPLAAGEYLVEVDAKTSSGTAQQMLAFKINR
jgi:VWFA-related protein